MNILNLKMKESINTGVIYKITNIKNGKIYVGKAFSYVKNGKQKIRRHGAKDRLHWHLNKAFSDNKKINNECPLLYKAMREFGRDCWEVKTLIVCQKKDLKRNETKLINQLKSHQKDVGYNFFIGDNKPIDSDNRKQYEKKKINSNRKRAKNSALKRSDASRKLPTNIYYRKSKLSGGVVEGYFVQIKINGKYKSKAFMSKKITMEEKLLKAKDYLANIKKDYNID